ncbi:MAG: peptidase S8 [Phycisphaerales bacterium]|nr:MAG: peptidase S8 [Phycisphaerales bacterium]
MKTMRCSGLVTLCFGALVFCVAQATAGDAGAAFTMGADSGRPSVLLAGEAVHSTDARIEGFQSIGVGATQVALWTQREADGAVAPWYAVSFDGTSVAAVKRTSYVLKLRYANFDPLKAVPGVPPDLAAGADHRVYVVQFVTQPLQAYRDAIESHGGLIRFFLPDHAYMIEMSAEAKAAIEALPFVRWVGPYHPAYKLEAALWESIRQPGAALETQQYNVQVLEPGFDMKQRVADRIESLGGIVEPLEPHSYLLKATMDHAALMNAIALSEVFFVDRVLPLQSYMEKVRVDGGADYVELVAGYTGEGVRAEVMDTELLVSHPAFQARPPLIHRAGESQAHGTSVYGIVFGDGTGNPNGRGMMPDAQGIFAWWAPPDRYATTAELLQAPYFAILQTNSWGRCCTTSYGADAQMIDHIAFDLDFLILQAQANSGSRNSDVHAWGKNIISVGGIRHFDTQTRDDDRWGGAGSIGPAEDGRIKPELAYWYDSILTTSRSGGYTPSFGGTSAATPETAGHIGLMYQMWNDGIFGNPVDPEGTVFENRPHLATAKAMMINTVEPYPFTGQGHDLTRVHQGFGLPNVRNLFNLRDQMYIIDETDVLENLASTTHLVDVAQNTPALKATLVYTDIPGTTSANQHRINDLSIKVTSPSGDVYYGNNGLRDGNWSTPGGNVNTKDTVENVWVQNPEEGTWSIEVSADEVNEDSHTETPEIDADYALVVSGVIAADPEPGACCFDDGSCEDLLPDDCATRGGRFNFNRECGTFQCPRAGACCVTDSECRQLLPRECSRIPGAEFIGEGVSCERACICDQLKKFKGKCKGSGTLKGIVKFRDDRYDGRTVKVQVGDRLRFDLTVRGRKAQLFTCCFSGPTLLTLLDPEGCVAPVTVDCPE